MLLWTANLEATFVSLALSSYISSCNLPLMKAFATTVPSLAWKSTLTRFAPLVVLTSAMSACYGTPTAGFGAVAFASRRNLHKCMAHSNDTMFSRA